ncbi:MAG: succinate dehydrogenase [Candidatus Latescibacteria bacterium]|nr:succinate dehydrogenase [Candidatus Latescibacterota bacterium]
MAEVTEVAGRIGFGETLRRDAWWVAPLATALGLGAFGVYSFWAALQGNHYESSPYLSPFYSPLILVDWWKFSPAFLILWAPLGFRATCYYYRKAYYRSYFLDPPACAVGEFRDGKYKGETAFPFILQNLHRYMLIPALALIAFLWHDAYNAFFFSDGLHMGVGSLVLTANAFLLSGYTLGCHSLRHLVGGRLDCFSCATLGNFRHGIWEKQSVLNRFHMGWAWTSLFMVGFSDVYVRLLSMGVVTDVRLI